MGLRSGTSAYTMFLSAFTFFTCLSLTLAAPTPTKTIPFLELVERASPYQSLSASEAPGGTIDNDGGASGSDPGSFSLSKGAIVAISVAVGLVAVFAIASTILWYVAKKRQWEVRKTLKRVSRRLTGRGNVPTRAERDRQSRRQGAVRMQSSDNMSGDKRRNNRNTTVQGTRDLEKGGAARQATGQPRNQLPRGQETLLADQKKKVAKPTETMEVKDPQEPSQPQEKRIRAILPPSWSVGGRKSGNAGR